MEAKETKEPEKAVAKVVPMPKPFKFKVSEILPADIVDVWRLYEKSLKLAPPKYPSMERETPEYIRAQLFQGLSVPNFLGFIARQGRKPIGQFTAHVGMRPLGMPRVYLQPWLFWVEPEFRKQGIAEALKAAMAKTAKEKGIHDWESLTEAHLVETFKVMGDFEQVGVILSGKIRLE